MKSLLLLIPLLFCSVSVEAQLRYSGEETIWQDTVWQGEVLVDGILTIAPEVTLEIRPGTVVRFTRKDVNNDNIGEHELFVQGIFLARGTVDKPILFTSAERNPVPGDWGTINMMASPEDNVLEHCRVEYGYRGFHAHFAKARLTNSVFRYNRRGAQFQESTVDISHCRFEDNFNGVQFRDSTVTMQDTEIRDGYWGLRAVYSTLDMRGCLIENNRINGVNFRDSEVVLHDNRIRDNRRGLYLQRTNAVVTENRIDRNSEHGIFLEEATGRIDRNRIDGNGRAGFRMINSPVEIFGNQITANDEYALINDGDQDVNITGNWWGTDDQEVLADMIRDGMDREGLGRVVLVDPLAKAPIMQRKVY